MLWALLAANWTAVPLLDRYAPGSTAIITGMALVLVLVGILHVYRVFG